MVFNNSAFSNVMIFYFKRNTFQSEKSNQGPKSSRKLHTSCIRIVSLNQTQSMSTVICMQNCLLDQHLSDKLFCNKEVD